MAHFVYFKLFNNYLELQLFLAWVFIMEMEHECVTNNVRQLAVIFIF
jgi:hypothetical protein